MMMTGGLASSTYILLFCFLYFLLSFSSPRIPFHSQHIINSFSLPQNNPNSHHPIPESTVDVHLTQSSSNDLPVTLFSFDPRIPRRHPLPFRIRHRCHHYKPWKPQSRQSNNNIGPRGGVKHVARAWKPMLSHQRGMDMEKSELLKRLYRRHHHDDDYDEPAEIKVKTGFVKRIRKFLNHF